MDLFIILGIIWIAGSVGFMIGAWIGTATRERHWQERMYQVQRDMRLRPPTR